MTAQVYGTRYLTVIRCRVARPSFSSETGVALTCNGMFYDNKVRLVLVLSGLMSRTLYALIAIFGTYLSTCETDIAALKKRIQPCRTEMMLQISAAIECGCFKVQQNVSTCTYMWTEHDDFDRQHKKCGKFTVA